LEQIYQTPHFKLLQSYIKPNGYIGIGAHSWDNWQGMKLHETPFRMVKQLHGCCPTLLYQKFTRLLRISLLL
jgi:hypothetical protein